MKDFTQKDYSKKYRKKIQKERPWYAIWRGVKYRCSKNGVYFSRGISCSLTKDDVEALWNRDGASMMKSPSIDRINTMGNYTFDNCRFVEFNYNAGRSHTRPDRMLVQRLDLNGKPLETYLNCRVAMRHTGVHCANILRAIREPFRRDGGFMWKLVPASVGYSENGVI